MRCLALILAFALVGCQTVRPPVVPKIVHVTVKEMVEVPAKLTAPCDEVAKKDNSYGEAIRLANARKAALAECSGRMAEIRALGQKP